MKQKLIDLLTDFRIAVEQEDVVTLINMFDKLGIDTKRYNPLGKFVCGLMIEDIKKAVFKKKDGILKVSRKNEYHEKTYDFYKIKDNTLLRNGHEAEWSSIGKLYQAYKKIHKIT